MAPPGMDRSSRMSALQATPPPSGAPSALPDDGPGQDTDGCVCPACGAQLKIAMADTPDDAMPSAPPAGGSPFGK